jgi:hypothetical protein
MTSGCGGRHLILRVYDVISCERRDKMACNHDIRESENSREQKFPTFLSCFYFICGTILMTHTLILCCHLWFTRSQYTSQATNTAKWCLIVYHVQHVHMISCHLATSRTMSHVTSSTSLLVRKTNHITRPTEHRLKWLKRHAEVRRSWKALRSSKFRYLD